MSAYEELLQFSKRWKHLGCRTLDSGACFVGPPSEPGKYDYLVCMMSPLTNDEINELEDQLHVPLHADLKDFYRHANGFSCFSRWLNLYGLREVHRSFDIEQMLDQPYDIVIENEDGPPLPQEGLLLISKYSDGSPTYLNLEGRCKAYSRDQKLLFEWANLREWVSQELNRFASYLDENASCEIGMENIPPPANLS